MKIAINCCSFLKGQFTGIGRYTYNLVKELSAIDQDNRYQLYARKSPFAFNKKLPRFNAKNFAVRPDLFDRGPGRSLKNIDIYHAPSPEMLDISDGIQAVVTIHDVIFKAFPEGHTEDTIRISQQQFERIRAKANKIICSSNATVEDVKKYFQIPGERITRIYQGVDKSSFYRIGPDERSAAEQCLKDKGIEGPFILSVGTIEPRKNLKNLIRAFHRLRSDGVFRGQLAMIGMQGWMQQDIGFLIAELGLNECVTALGYVPDEELRYFYNSAAVFCYPSFYEGFGYPILEAFCCGAPVVTSNVSSCPEIAGDAALTVDPHNDEAIAGAMNRIITDPALGRDLREKGLQRAEAFDFRKTAEETLAVYRDVYDGSRVAI